MLSKTCTNIAKCTIYTIWKTTLRHKNW